MKKKIFIIVGIIALLIIAVGVTTTIMGAVEGNKKREDFYTFREELDKEFFPLLHDTGDHLESVADKINSGGISDFMVESGYDTNLDLQSRLKTTKKVIIETPVKYEDTIKLKDSTLSYITELEDVLQYTYNESPSQYEHEEIQIFDAMISTKVDGLEEHLDELNKILDVYYD